MALNRDGCIIAMTKVVLANKDLMLKRLMLSGAVIPTIELP